MPTYQLEFLVNLITMKFLSLLILCCVAKNIYSATTYTITIGSFLQDAQQRINSAVAEQNKKAAAAGSTVQVKAPNVPTPANPNQVIKNPPVIPLGNPKCDFKGFAAILKALLARIKASFSNVKKSRGPLKQQCEGAKANLTAEFSEATMKKITVGISYEFKTCSSVVDPKIKDFTAKATKLIDAITAAASGGDAKKCGKDISVSVKDLLIALKVLCEQMNSVTGSAKPAAGSNAADAVATSDVLLVSCAQLFKTLLDLSMSVAGESNVEVSDMVKKSSASIDALNKKVEGGSKIIGSLCIEFTMSLTVIIKMESSVDKDEVKKECDKNEKDLDEAIKSASDIEDVDDEEEDKDEGGENETETPPGGDTPPDPSGETPTEPSGEGSGEKPTAKDCLDKISLVIKVSFEGMKKTCGALKTDAPSMDGKFDESMTKISASLADMLKNVESSENATVTDSSTKMDATIAAFATGLSDFIASLNTVLESLSKDDSVAGKTAVEALKMILESIVSQACKVIKTLKIFYEKLKLFLTVETNALIEAVGKVDVKSADFKVVAKDFIKATSSKELNAESCKKVIEDLGKSSKDAVGKIKVKFSGKFGLRISRICEAFGYISKKVKAPKVTDGMTKIKDKFSGLTKEIETACSCAKESKEKASGEGSGEKKKCKSIAPGSSKSFYEVLLMILEAVKTAVADTTMDPESLEILRLIVKEFFTTTTDIFAGLSTTLAEQTTDTSVSIKLGAEVLTKATGEPEIDYEKLATDVKDLSVYTNTVDTATPDLDSVKEVETKMSAPAAEGETKDTKAILSEESTCASTALTTLSTSTATFSEYFTKPVDPVAKSQTKLSAAIKKFIESVKTASDATAIAAALEVFLVEISSVTGELTTAYSECDANTKTELDPKGYNAKTALKLTYQYTWKIMSSVFTCFKAHQGEIPAELSEFFGGVSDAMKAEGDNPDPKPKELGDKVKESCDKHKAKGGK